MFWHKYSLSELDSLYPWEKILYVEMIAAEIQKEKEKRNSN